MKRFAACVDPCNEVPASRVQRRCRSNNRNANESMKSPATGTNKSSDEAEGDSSGETSSVEPKRRRTCRVTTRKSTTVINTPVTGRNTRNSCATPLTHRQDVTSVSERLSSTAPDKPKFKRGRPFKNKPPAEVSTLNDKEKNCNNSQKKNLDDSQSSTKIKCKASMKENYKVTGNNDNESLDSEKELNIDEVTDEESKDNQVDDLPADSKKEEIIIDDEPCSRVVEDEVVEDGESKSSCSNSTDSKDSQSCDSNCGFKTKFVYLFK